MVRSTVLRVLYRPGSNAGPTAVAATAQAPSLLIGGLGDYRLDAAPSQVGPDGPAGVGLVGQDSGRPGARPAGARPGDAQLAHQGHERQRIVPLTGAGQPGQRPAGGIGEQVNLAAQPAARAAQRLAVS